MNIFEKALADKLMEMRRGPHDVKKGRSKPYQKERDEYHDRLLRVRKNVEHGAHPSNLKKIRRTSGQHPMPKEGDLPKEMVGGSRGRTARHGGEQTDPRAPAGTERSGAYVEPAKGESELSPEQARLQGQEADVSKDQGRRSRDTATGHGAKRTRRGEGDAPRNAPVISPEMAATLKARIKDTDTKTEEPERSPEGQKRSKKTKAADDRAAAKAEPETTTTQASDDSEKEVVSMGQSSTSSRGQTPAQRKARTMKAAARRKIGAKKKQKKTWKKELKDTADVQNPWLGEHFQETLLKAILINEIGDTPEGKERIKKAYEKRRDDVLASHETANDLKAKHGLEAPTKDVARLAKGEVQLNKVRSYMGGRRAGEAISDTPVMKKVLGDMGAMARFRKYKEGLGDQEATLKDFSKRHNLGATGKGVKKARRNIERKSRDVNWNQGMPPGESHN